MSTTEAIAAFGLAALVFAALLMTGSIAVSLASDAAIAPFRTAGPAVKRWSGVVLIAVGLWFAILAGLPSPIFGA